MLEIVIARNYRIFSPGCSPERIARPFPSLVASCLSVGEVEGLVVLTFVMGCGSNFAWWFKITERFVRKNISPTVARQACVKLKFSQVSSRKPHLLPSFSSLQYGLNSFSTGTQTRANSINMDGKSIGMVGMGDMGKLYARRLSSAGWK